MDNIINTAKRIFRGTQGTFLGLIVLTVFFSLASPYFFQARNFINILDQVTVLGIMALGMTAVIIIGGIDLSVGSILALSMMVTGWVWDAFGVPLHYACLVGIFMGSIAGLINGLLVSYLRLPAFIATLAMLSAARGLANIFTDGKQIYGFPEWLTNLSVVRHFGFIPITMLVFVFLTILCWVLLKYRKEGRNLYAIGGNPEVARLSGINVKGTTVIVYTISGFLSGIAGILLTARLNTCVPQAGFTYELDVIAAVVIGGASLNGGVGGIAGTIVGVFIIGVLRNGLNLLGFSPFVQGVVIGAVIVFAVALDTFKKKER